MRKRCDGLSSQPQGWRTKAPMKNCFRCEPLHTRRATLGLRSHRIQVGIPLKCPKSFGNTSQARSRLTKRLGRTAMSQAEYEAALAQFLAKKAVTRCPTACVGPTRVS